MTNFLAKTNINALLIMKRKEVKALNVNFPHIINPKIQKTFSCIFFPPLLTPPRGGLKVPETPHCGQTTYTHLFTSLYFSLTQSFTLSLLQVFCFYSHSLLSHSIHFHLSIHLSPPWAWVVPSGSAPLTLSGVAAVLGGWAVSVQVREVSVASPWAAAPSTQVPMGNTMAWAPHWHLCLLTRACWPPSTWRSTPACPWAEPMRRSRSRASTTALQVL